MNEQQLKELWRKEELESFPTINFELVQESTVTWQRKLKRKIELDFLLGGFLLVIFISASIVFSSPQILYLYPFVAVIYFWYYRKLWQIYRGETKLPDNVSAKECLEGRALQLGSFVRENRIFTIVFGPPFMLAAYYVSLSGNSETKEFMSLDYIYTHTEMIYNALIFCGILTIVSIISVEVLLRIFYLPSLDRVKELLLQLGSEE